ncbi:MAG: alpha/beta fold hydrolase [Xanthomonadales bacterium]|nr:alpha/beta fold hydrolase [Xanthomonadales bacterium]
MTDTISATIGDAVRLPECVEIETGAKPRNAVIWLHGLGADGHDFEPLVPMLGMQRVAATRFIFPHAPVRPVTINGGMRMRAWYDIRGMDIRRDQDGEGIRDSAELVQALLAREADRGIPPARVVLAGFSQGGAIAAHVGLRCPERLAGLLLLSTYLLFPERFEQDLDPANRDTPAFVAHGSQDPVVPAMLGRDLASRLREAGLPVTWKEYAMPHAVVPEEIADISTWLVERLD